MINQELLSKIQSIVSIISSITIPVILAVFGYLVQDKIATEGLKKDYVQIAISVLKERKDAGPENDELRKWAVSVLASNSPIPFSKALRLDLEKGGLKVELPKGATWVGGSLVMLKLEDGTEMSLYVPHDGGPAIPVETPKLRLRRKLKN